VKTAVRTAQKGLVVRRRRPGPAVELDALAAEAGVHPDLVRRLLALGLLDAPAGMRAGRPFPRDAAAQVARAARLRRDLGLNYAGALLACQLLDRIERLEQHLGHYESADGQRR
jgi:hypothetical protein